jgi:hypothetical protein
MDDRLKALRKAGETFLIELPELEQNGVFNWDDVETLMNRFATELSAEGVRTRDTINYFWGLIDEGVREAMAERNADEPIHSQAS